MVRKWMEMATSNCSKIGFDHFLGRQQHELIPTRNQDGAPSHCMKEKDRGKVFSKRTEFVWWASMPKSQSHRFSFIDGRTKVSIPAKVEVNWRGYIECVKHFSSSYDRDTIWGVTRNINGVKWAEMCPHAGWGHFYHLL